MKSRGNADPAQTVAEPARAPRYPEESVRALIASDLVTPATREVLLERLHAAAEPAPRALNATTFETLRAVLARLIPQHDRATPIDIATAIDTRLARGHGKGWRYASLPPDLEAYRRGLDGVDEHARAQFGASFIALDNHAQDEVLRAVQLGSVTGPSWYGLSPSRLFDDWVAEAVECYYSHPLAQEEIGYAGFADAHGWQALGLGRLAPHEPRPKYHEPAAAPGEP